MRLVLDTTGVVELSASEAPGRVVADIRDPSEIEGDYEDRGSGRYLLTPGGRFVVRFGKYHMYDVIVTNDTGLQCMVQCIYTGNVLLSEWVEPCPTVWEHLDG